MLCGHDNKSQFLNRYYLLGQRLLAFTTTQRNNEIIFTLEIIAIINEYSIIYDTQATWLAVPRVLCLPEQPHGSPSSWPPGPAGEWAELRLLYFLAHLPHLLQASAWVSAKWPQEGAMSHAVYLWAFFCLAFENICLQ